MSSRKKTKYVHWTVVACQPCAFRINHVDNGFRSEADSDPGAESVNATCRKMQRRWRVFLFSSVCKGLQSSWRTSQNTINVKHQNDCRSGTFRLSEGQRWSLCSLLLVESLKVDPRIFLSFFFETLKPSLVFGIHQDHFLTFILLVLWKLWPLL